MAILGFNTRHVRGALRRADGAVLHSINTPLNTPTIAFMLQHGEAKLLITDRRSVTDHQPSVKDAGQTDSVIDIDDPLAIGGALLGEKTL